MERRWLTATHLEVRHNGKGALLVGYVVEWEKLSAVLYGGYREKVRKGAFAKSLRSGRVVKALWNHNSDLVLASTGNETLSLWEDGQGLRFEAEPAGTSWGADAVVSIKRGDVDGVSFGFVTIQDEWNNSDPKNVVRTLVEVELHEISPCAFPAYEGATSVGVRSAQNVWEGYRAKDPAAGLAAAGQPKSNRDRIRDLDILKREMGLMEFRNFAEFAAAVRFDALKLRALNMSEGAAGGFLVPAQVRGELMRIEPGAAIVRPRATVIPAGDPPDAPVEIPALTQGANGVLGGVTVQWLTEDAVLPPTEPNLEQRVLAPQELAAITTPVSDKLLRNSAASGYLAMILRNAIFAAEDEAFLVGDGVGRPLGALNCPGRLVVDRAGAGAVGAGDVTAMLVRLLPSSFLRAVWVAHISLLPGLTAIPLFRMGENGPRSITLAGIPLFFTDATPVLGNEGDLMLCDFNYYLIKDGAGPFVDVSAHQAGLYERNQSLIKAFFAVDGQGLPATPLLLRDGVTQASPFVILR